jgi:predicted acyl esterase
MPALLVRSVRNSLYLLPAVIVLSACSNILLAAEPAFDLGPVEEQHVMAPMRDGVRLSTYLYLPKGKGPWPVLYEQRYADITSAGTRKSCARLAAAGYVVAMQNFRGTHKSEGTWVGYRDLGWGEKQDGYDTVEWLAQQPWSTGKVGTFGSSQGGFVQNFLAVAAPPHLTCQYMIDTGLSLYHEGYRIGGAAKPERFKTMAAVCRNADDNRRLMEEWFRHPKYDDYWAQEDCTRHFGKMNVPCFTIGSWYDFMSVGSIDSYVGRSRRGGPQSRDSQQLLLGPWLHGRFKETNQTGEMTYPENAKFAMEAHMIRWFDHYLKGVDNGVEREPKVRYYVMGAVGEADAPGNQWRSADDWPVPATATPFYLQSGGELSKAKPTEANAYTEFSADPLHPNEIPARGFPGAKDARDFEQQSEVRTFTSEVLREPVEWTGAVHAELYVTSTARDTDFIVRVSDVYPDGRSILIMDMIRRARYRDGYEQEVLLEPGNVAKVAFKIGSLSQIFNRGHRIRVTVASTGAPFYEPNPNTGEPLTIEFPDNAIVATNRVLHDAEHASHIIAPVRP